MEAAFNSVCKSFRKKEMFYPEFSSCTAKSFESYEYIPTFILFFEKNVSCQNVKNVNCRPTFKKMFCNLNKPNVNHHTKIVGYYRL